MPKTRASRERLAAVDSYRAAMGATGSGEFRLLASVLEQLGIDIKRMLTVQPEKPAGRIGPLGALAVAQAGISIERNGMVPRRSPVVQVVKNIFGKYLAVVLVACCEIFYSFTYQRSLGYDLDDLVHWTPTGS